MAACAWFAASSAAAPSRQDPTDEAATASAADELAEARASADRRRRRGDFNGARKELDELLSDDPADAESRALLALVRRDEGDLAAALAEARRALADCKDAAGPARDASARALAALELERGEARAALAALAAADPAATGSGASGADPRDAWLLGEARRLTADRDGARAAWASGARAGGAGTWEQRLAAARCQRRLGDLGAASATLVAALAEAEQAEGGSEPDLLVELGDLYFEADGEVEHKESRNRSPAPLYDQALKLDPKHEGAQVSLYELYRFNWMRQRRSAYDILAELLRANPRSIAGLVAGASADLDDGQLVAAREKLTTLEKLAPARRDVRALRASLAWIEHQNEQAEERLAALVAEDPRDGEPERELGRHLCELYRFAEALPFLERATQRDPGDWQAWTQLGRAQANTGNETEALASLKKSTELAAGRADAWRHNMTRVLEKLAREFQDERFGELSFAWSPAAADVFRAYWVPFYAKERADLAARYGYTPGPTHIEVFASWRDFSVRSTGFEGYPALGVCFGPVVTSVSPISELRGTFSWARTAFHEFTHVIHLGLSHNRCPRWITEGIATWEEENQAPNWTRNMRRELIDALANDDLLRVREMNRAFRGQRILFGYYQCGLIVRMWIEKYGFPPLVGLLQAFDAGADLDQALAQVLKTTPEAVDAEFRAYAQKLVGGLEIEPRWSTMTIARLRIALARKPPTDATERKRWAEDTCALAWGQWQAGQKVDAEEVLRRLDQAGQELPGALFLRGEMAIARQDYDGAQASWKRGLELGGEDYRVRMALGRLAQQADDLGAAEAQYQAAEKAFPGYAERELSAELSLAALYTASERKDEALRAKERWLAWNDDFAVLGEVAAWHVEAGRFAQALALFARANEVDPFRRALHLDWARALEGAGKPEEALREYGVALIVPADLDAGNPGPWDPQERAGIIGRRALLAAKLARFAEALALADEALALDAECADALEAKKLKP